MTLPPHTCAFTPDDIQQANTLYPYTGRFLNRLSGCTAPTIESQMLMSAVL